jgi:hypothetical protein
VESACTSKDKGLYVVSDQTQNSDQNKFAKKKSCTGDITCQFCACDESSNHLFFRCFYAQQVWRWMGACQTQYQNWSSIGDVIQFTYSLPKINRLALLIVVCVVIWSIWKHRNDLCFNNSRIYTARNIILQILSLISYWTGTLQGELREAVQEWLPQELDAIPLQVMDHADIQMLDWVTGAADEE